MKKSNKVTLLFLFLFSISFSQQKDTLFGKIKSIREKVIFLTEKENPKVFEYDGDYGHYGFTGPESTIAYFKSVWFESENSHYINYRRNFNQIGQLVEEVWYDKKDSLENYYRYKYDDKSRLIRKIDSVFEYVNSEVHYYTNDTHETIITQNSEFNRFKFEYKKYDQNGRTIRLKQIDKYGILNEYIYKYNDEGKLLYRIHKNPNSWKQRDSNIWGYGPTDTVTNVYKDVVNKYDESNRLIERKGFDLYSDKNHKEPKLTGHTIFKYKKGNLFQEIKMRKYQIKKPRYITHIYDYKNRLIEKHCCTEDLSESIRIEEYKYKKNQIEQSKFTYGSKSNNKRRIYKVKFKYKYDEKGNWNKIIKTVNGIKRYEWIRELEYYH